MINNQMSLDEINAEVWQDRAELLQLYSEKKNSIIDAKRKLLQKINPRKRKYHSLFKISQIKTSRGNTWNILT